MLKRLHLFLFLKICFIVVLSHVYQATDVELRSAVLAPPLGLSNQASAGTNNLEPNEEEILRILGAKDFYERLGVSSDASPDEIKQAYRRVARRYHPDKWPSTINKRDHSRFSEVFRRADEAYRVLSDREKRKRYDRSHISKRAKREKEITKEQQDEAILSSMDLDQPYWQEVLYEIFTHPEGGELALRQLAVCRHPPDSKKTLF